MDCISLGGRGPPPSPPQTPLTRQFMRGLRPSNSPWIGFLPATGSVLVCSSQGRFFCLGVLAQQMLYFVIYGPDVLKKMKILSDLVTFHQLFMISKSQPTSSEHLFLKCRWSGKCANHDKKNMKIATYFFRILLLTGTYFIRVVWTYTCVCTYF